MKPLICPRLFVWIVFAFVFAVFPTVLSGQTNCESGDGVLNSEWPERLKPEDVIQKFAAKESLFEAARRSYSFTQDVTVQTLRDITPRGKPIVDGEYRQVADVSFDPSGKRIERVTFAPQSSLRRIAISPQDLEDIREFMPFALATSDLPKYKINYVGQQRVDELDTYVFDVGPKSIDRGNRYFSGRIWVENRDFAIVKTCGKSVPDTAPSRNKKNGGNIQPKFVTYREQIDGQWFPTYSRSDDFLFFSTGFVRIREIVKYTNYKQSDSQR
jgi:hypothetical protein